MMISQPTYDGSADYILKRAFKFRSLNPSLEAELGRRMLAHELPIDRGYLSDRLNCTPFPNRTQPALRIIKCLLEKAERHIITRYELVNRDGHDPSTVVNVLRKLEAGRAITQFGVHANGRKLYRVFPPNRVILEEILRG